MITYGEYQAIENFISGLGLDPIKFSLLRLIETAPFSYLGARICYYGGEKLENLIEETHKAFKRDILVYFSGYTDNQLPEELKTSKSAIKFLFNLLLKGHTSVFGTTYTIIPLDVNGWDEKATNTLLLNLLQFPKGSFYTKKYDDILYVVLNNRIFAEYILKSINVGNLVECELEDYLLLSEIFDELIRFHEKKYFFDSDIYEYLDKFVVDNPNNVIFIKRLATTDNSNLSKHYPLESITKILGFKFDVPYPRTPLFIRPFEIVDTAGKVFEQHSINLYYVLNRDFRDFHILHSNIDFREFVNAITTSFFIIWGTNRITTHQIVRHKTLDFLQKSNRYRDIKKDDLEILPLEIFEKIMGAGDKYKAFLKDFYLEHNNELYEKYKYLKKSGIKKEATRYLLPQFQKTNIVMAGINRYIEDFINQRIQVYAQPEIRIVAEIMSELQNTTLIHQEIKYG